jgi:hypothetical protein
VGVLDGEEYTEPEGGTAQGSVLSPLLGNVYLHYVLDLWFEREIRPRLRGRAYLVRYADDFVIALEDGRDAEQVMAVLPKRMGRYGLILHPDKTRRARLARTHLSIAEYCRSHRHDSVEMQHAALTRRLRGHFNYFGVNGNVRSLEHLVRFTRRTWLKWLRRRSQRSRLSWERYALMLERFPLPVPQVMVQIWDPRS